MDPLFQINASPRASLLLLIQSQPTGNPYKEKKLPPISQTKSTFPTHCFRGVLPPQTSFVLISPLIRTCKWFWLLLLFCSESNRVLELLIQHLLSQQGLIKIKNHKPGCLAQICLCGSYVDSLACVGWGVQFYWWRWVRWRRLGFPASVSVQFWGFSVSSDFLFAWPVLIGWDGMSRYCNQLPTTAHHVYKDKFRSFLLEFQLHINTSVVVLVAPGFYFSFSSTIFCSYKSVRLSSFECLWFLCSCLTMTDTPPQLITKSYKEAMCEEPLPVKKPKKKAYKKLKSVIISEQMDPVGGVGDSLPAEEVFVSKANKSHKGKGKMVEEDEPNEPEPMGPPVKPVTENFTGQKDLDSFFERLNQVRYKTQSLHQTCLVGSVFGGMSDFYKLRTKLKGEWQSMVGSVDVYDRFHGWFEVRFANPIDLKKVWDDRPYHVAGQLVVLQKWTPSFDPTTARITSLDLYMRIPKLPVEFMCKEAILDIFKTYEIGTFLRFDKLSARKLRLSFTRFVANVDLTYMPGFIFLPDGNGGAVKYTLWYEDFPKGCGFCGDEDHSFQVCPDRETPPQNTTITIRQPPVLESAPGGDGDWIHKSKGKKPFAATTGSDSLKPYMTGELGIKVEFKAVSKASSGGSSMSFLASAKVAAAASCLGNPAKETSPTMSTNFQPGKDGSKITTDDDKEAQYKVSSGVSESLQPASGSLVEVVAADEDMGVPLGQVLGVAGGSIPRVMTISSDQEFSNDSYKTVLSMSTTHSMVNKVGTLGITTSISTNSDSGKKRMSEMSDDAGSAQLKRIKPTP